MKKILVVVSFGLMMATAANAGGGHSVSSPGQQFRTNGGPPTTGPTAGYPGASGYGPGRIYNSPNGPTGGSPGASVYAPGFLK